MRTPMRNVGNVLVAAAAVVGVGTITAIATGYELHLTTEMVQLLIYKAFGAAAVGLMIVGTWIGRAGAGSLDFASESVQPSLDDFPQPIDKPALSPDGVGDIYLNSPLTPDHAAAPVPRDPTYREP